MSQMPMAHDMMHASYDLPMVVLSILIASVSAYLALSLAERLTHNQNRARYLWLAGGACAMGTGIWSMHFTGMLAYHLPVSISYDVPTVLISLIVAIIASGVALFVVSRPSMSPRSWLIGGFLMGIGVAVMHYTGMAAMRLPATVRWDLRIVAASAAIAIIVSLIALRLVFNLRALSVRRFEWRRTGAAVIMGFAVAGMHYTGMAAATFLSMPGPPATGDIIAAAALGGGAIAVVTFLVLILGLSVAYVDRRFMARELVLSETRSHFRAVLASAPVVLFALNIEGVITMAQGRDLARVRCDADRALGCSFFEIFAEVPMWIDQARRALSGEELTAIADVHGTVMETRWTPVHGSDGIVTGLIAVGTDITQRRRAEEALAHQAFHDDLTGLPNRAALNQRLATEINVAQTRRLTLVLAVLDLNRFKIVNDTLGHQAGDALLQKVGVRLCKTLRGSDFVARLGGDEFAIIVPDATAAEGEELVARIVSILSAPFEIEGHLVEISAAVGLALYPTQATDVTTLLSHADIAMYVAKRATVGYALYDVNHDPHSSSGLMLESGLRKAITENELVLHYQPKIDFATRRVDDVEALVRWNHPTLGLLSPDAFIPMAEQSGSILPLTRWVLETALQQMNVWQSGGLDIRVAINLSTRTLGDPALPRLIEELLQQHAVPPGRLTLEITETALMADVDATRLILTELGALGVMISVDDFGTGYSSLAYLAQLPVNELKIDKAFVMAMHANEKDAAIVRWINGLGHILGMRVVAEGVETAEALETLNAMGCDLAQGYHLSRPLPANELGLWMLNSPWVLSQRAPQSALRA
jgi:diguanylate cyclase (GGDEF)-like protein